LILYGDTSALLKLYIQEAGTETVQEAIAASDSVTTHVIAYPELRAALAKAARVGRIDSDHLQALVADLHSDWPYFQTLGVDQQMVNRAGELAHQYGLRGYDSVHLAAAEALAARVAPAPFRFAVFDGELTEAARSLGLAMVGEH